MKTVVAKLDFRDITRPEARMLFPRGLAVDCLPRACGRSDSVSDWADIGFKTLREMVQIR
jgi:hypothetical protein